MNTLEKIADMEKRCYRVYLFSYRQTPQDAHGSVEFSLDADKVELTGQAESIEELVDVLHTKMTNFLDGTNNQRFDEQKQLEYVR